MRISSSDIVRASAGWLCHRALRSLSISSFGTACSLVKLAAQEDLDPVNFRGDIAGRKARDRSNRRGINSFQIQEDDLLVVGLKSLNQRPKTFQCLPLV